ncbi:serine/threonine-protein kinase [Pauljensenia sp. 20925_1_34]|uniref:serine/threonine-protein kinase n=1 Tax=Pauljensenia sp. 20925_1_34 TaxID=3003674 RepID=UPI00352F8542
MTRAGVVGTGPRIEGFRWIRALGSGGFADVHLYHQQVPSRDVAIKIARSNVEGGNEAIRHEADAMARVSSHPTIVNLHGVGALDDGREFLIMEYCPVTNIADQVRAHPMDVPAALDLIIRISSGVEMLHRMGYVHRDIKPGNIMLDSYQSPVLTDFGVSARIGEGRDGGLEGFSVMWAPPEQHDGSAPADPSQDVWALGASLWTLLVGRSPFEDPIGDNSTVAVAMRVRSGRLRSIGRADAPEELDLVLRAAMNVDPARRLRTALAFAQSLQGIQTLMGLPETPIEVREEAPIPRPTEPSIAGHSGYPVPTTPDEQGTKLRVTSAAQEHTVRAGGGFDFSESGVVPVADSWHHPRNQSTGRAAATSFEGEEERKGRSVPFLAVVTLAVIAAVAAAGLVVAMLTGGGQSVRIDPVDSPSANGDDPADLTVPPTAPSGLNGRLEGESIVWTWTAPPDPNYASEDLAFQYRLDRPGEAPMAASSPVASVTLPAAHGGDNCLTVRTVVSASGLQSQPVSICVAVE